MPKFKKTVYAVLAFIIFLIFMFMAEEAHALDNQHNGTVTIGVSGGIVNYPSGVTTYGGYRTGSGKWEAAYEILGGKGYREVHSISVSRVVWKRPDQTGLYGSLGLTATDRNLAKDEPDAKDIVSSKLTYRLGIGYSWKLSSSTHIRFGLLHNSTAGRSDRNKGIDRLLLSFDWRI